LDDLPAAKSNVNVPRDESQTTLRDTALRYHQQDFLQIRCSNSPRELKKVLALTRCDQHNNATAPSRSGRPHARSSKDQAKLMSTQSPDETELARLRAAVDDCERKISEAAELVARVRHEINNPLAALLGQAQLLLREELSEKSRRRAEIIEAQAKRIQEIAGELRAVQAPPSASNSNPS
jgi:signal transduction histidine kinase